MPTKINLPQINDITLIDTIVEERANGRNSTFFDNYKTTWNERYQEYINNNGNPESIVSSTIQERDKKKFINLYEKKPHSINTQIIQPTKEHNLTFCPLCSEMGTPMTLDHFLPKDKYPEFSILSKNLVPACDACQAANAKGSKIFNGDGNRLFLHPYYDDIENIEIIKIKILPPYNVGTNYELFINENLGDDNLINLCKRHVDELRIDERFRIFFSTEYLRKRDLIKSLIQPMNINNKDDLKEAINIFYENSKTISPNYWDSIIYKAFINNDELLDFLLN